LFHGTETMDELKVVEAERMPHFNMDLGHLLNGFRLGVASIGSPQSWRKHSTQLGP